MQAKITNHKYITLDSLRGIAAVMVIFQHFWEMNHASDNRYKPWLFFCSGHEAVILFFVLSGFVLTHQLRNYSLSNYGEFIIRRILRVYPAYYIALLCSVVLLLIIRNYYPATLDGHGLTNWFYVWSQTSFDKTMLFGSLTILSHDGNSLNVVVWTLFYEMWISFIFPLVIIGIWRTPQIIGIFIVITLSIISYQFWLNGMWLQNSWAGISYYLWYFILGAALYSYHYKLRFMANNLTLLIGCGLYFSNYLLFGKIHDRLIHEVIISVGCFLILLNGIYNQHMQKILQYRLFRFYGKISYSLYLFHLPVLYGLSYWLLRTTHDYMLALKVLTFVVASFVAWISYEWIELFGIRFAKNIFVR